MRRTGGVPGGSDAYARALAELGRELAGPDGLNAAIARLYERFDHYSWIGFYRVEGGELVLGPWRGPQATEHVRIPVGKGICGAAAASGATEVVEDVAADPRYLSCFVSTRSEIVVPVSRGGRVVGEIDIDSDRPGAFDDHDRAFLERVAKLIGSSGAIAADTAPPASWLVDEWGHESFPAQRPPEPLGRARHAGSGCRPRVATTVRR
jgi:L-methionine (R)-S-oxide reductase